MNWMSEKNQKKELRIEGWKDKTVIENKKLVCLSSSDIVKIRTDCSYQPVYWR
jgi:hypothetical protein